MLATLKKRAEFLRIRGGGRWATAAFVLEGKLREGSQDEGQETTGSARFGFTVTKKIGNAVARNRIRRRLKAVVEQLAPDSARVECDYVLIARRAALARPYSDLKQDLEQAFKRVHRALDKRRPGAKG